MPVGRLLFNMAGPMIVSMLVQALYNVVDSVFVAQLNEDALSALSLAFPMQNFMIAVGTGLGVGVNALISRSLGERRQEAANGYAMQGLLLAGISYAVFLLIGLLGAGPLSRRRREAWRVLPPMVRYICAFAVPARSAFLHRSHWNESYSPPAVPC